MNPGFLLDDAGRRLRAFGEMVALLAADGMADAAVRLEELWNRLAATHHFSLLCAYPTSLGLHADDGAVRHQHTGVLESVAASSSAEDRNRAMVRLRVRSSPPGERGASRA